MNLIGGSKSRIAVVKIEGVVTDTGGFGADRAKIVASLKEAERRRAQGVVVRLNSPGGTVAACQEVFACILRMKDKGIPVVASMGDIAASGGVYISMAASEIVANPGTITGSIGVIIKSNNLSDLYGKVGVSPKVVKSGPYKDMLSAYRPFSKEEEELLQGVIDDSYDQFVEVVATARKKDRKEIEQIADGRIMTGRQAVRSGLIDTLGDLQTAVDRVATLAGLKAKPRLILIQPRKALLQRFLGPFGAYAGNLGGVTSLSHIPMWIMPTI
jgi:protease-4